MIQVESINKEFENQQVLFDVNAEFREGIINMIIGSSGSGKTVLLKCVVGLLKPETGKINYDGRDIVGGTAKQLNAIRREIGMLFQGAALFNSLNVEENVSFPLRMFTKMTQKEIEKRVAFCLDRVNLHDVNNLYPAELSGGMQKRVGIARAIVMNPKYLFYDEPNSGLDPKTSRVIDELIKEITQEFGTTTLVNSHDMASVFDVADRVFFIYEGKKWWEGKPGEITTSGNQELLQMIEASGQEGRFHLPSKIN